MELLVEALLTALVELLGEVIAVLGIEVLGGELCAWAVEAGPDFVQAFVEVLHGALGDRRRANVVCSVLALFGLGAIVGAVTLALRPAALVPPFVHPTLVLVGAPLVVGAVMEAYGRWRVLGGATVSHLASFFGGGAFALGWTIVRVWAHSR